MILIDRASIFTPTRRLSEGAVLIDKEQIVEVWSADRLTRSAGVQVVNAAGLLLIPGFIDLQLNGAFGQGFTTHPESIWPVAAELPRYGITTFLPTMIILYLAHAKDYDPDHPRGLRKDTKTR